MNKLPTAAAVLKEVSTIDGMLSFRGDDMHSVLPLALRRWVEMLSQFAELLERGRWRTYPEEKPENGLEVLVRSGEWFLDVARFRAAREVPYKSSVWFLLNTESREPGIIKYPDQWDADDPVLECRAGDRWTYLPPEAE